MREKLDEYVNNKLLLCKKEGDLELFCYTKDTFFGENTWDEVTMNHRGRLYYKGRSVNHPFKKIFNLDERPDTSYDVIAERMKNEDYDIMDKLNGHLFIMSVFEDDEQNLQIVYSTKGSLPNPDNELLNKDIEIFKEKYEDAVLNYLYEADCVKATLSFEAIVEHDKHTLYEEQVKKYGGENIFVLIGLNVYGGIDIRARGLRSDAISMGVPYPKIYEKSELSSDIRKWFDHKNIEGYVIRFDNDDRFKIKTKEYWSLRFLNELKADSFLSTFKGGGYLRIQHRFDEEISNEIITIVKSFFDFWVINHYVKVDEIDMKYFSFLKIRTPLSESIKKMFVEDNELTQIQKAYVSAWYGKSSFYPETNIDRRTEFVDWMNETPTMLDKMQQLIEQLVYKKLSLM